ncbi:hypothetical protein KY330_04760 [Candidatus Woesearchaeota archaeon]|nr:hypothetical protein [Candidatus Woesearchaeota archaeon]
MKSIFIHAAVSFNREHPFITQMRNQVFPIFLDVGRKKGLNVFISNYKEYNPKTRSVKRAWVFDKGWKLVKNQKVDLMYYHGKNANSKLIAKKAQRNRITMVNHPVVEGLCDDKILTALRFPDIMPKSFLVNNHYEFQKAMKFIQSDKIVLKPKYGSFGDNVLVLDRKKMHGAIQKDSVLQEFIDTSYGIKKLRLSGVHDLRVIVVDGKIDHSYVRMPPKGSFTCNMTRGATKKYIENDKIPGSVVKLVKHIDSDIKQYGSRIYSADFMFDPEQKPWLVEMNSKPGTLYYQDNPKVRIRYYRNIFKSLKKAV